MVLLKTKEELKSVLAKNGERSVIHFGIVVRLKLSVVNLGTQTHVSIIWHPLYTIFKGGVVMGPGYW